MRTVVSQAQLSIKIDLGAFSDENGPTSETRIHLVW